jgi:MscS family membrane protein
LKIKNFIYTIKQYYQNKLSNKKTGAKEEIMPNYSRSIIIWGVFFVLALGPMLPAAGWGQLEKSGKEGTVRAVTNSPAATAPQAEKPIPVKPKKLDQAGEKVGEGIDRFGKKAASQLGGWINAEVFAGITWMKLLFCLLLLFAVAVIERTIRAAMRRYQRDEIDDMEKVPIRQLVVEALTKPLSLFIWAYGVYAVLALLFVHFRQPDGTNVVHLGVQKVADVAVAIAIIWFSIRLVSIVDVQLRKWAASTESTIDDILVPLVGKTLRIFILIIGAIIVIQNLTGVKIGPLLASLGIGGLAVALAARESIANFFGTLTILFDKPFQVGQRIVINSHDGIVDSVGFRSTRIRTLTGHLLTIPNEKLVSSAVENIGVRPHIRWLTNIGVTYDTPPDKVEKAVTIIREILADHEGMHADYPPRVFFNGFNDCNLNIMVVVWYHPPNYWDYQAWLQKICLEIMRGFEAEGIDFAFPTQTVHLANDDSRQLKIQLLDAAGEEVPGPVTAA